MIGKDTEAIIKLATETMRACRVVIEALTAKEVEPKLVGLVQASQMVNRSRVWLRRKLEKGELTGFQTGKGGNWQLDPDILVQELKIKPEELKRPVLRRKKNVAL